MKTIKILTSTDYNWNIILNQYDENWNLIEIKKQVLNKEIIQKLEYDLIWNLVKTIDPAWNITTLSYNEKNELVKISKLAKNKNWWFFEDDENDLITKFVYDINWNITENRCKW